MIHTRAVDAQSNQQALEVFYLHLKHWNMELHGIDSTISLKTLTGKGRHHSSPP
jgi:hypothetical protein